MPRVGTPGADKAFYGDASSLGDQPGAGLAARASDRLLLVKIEGKRDTAGPPTRDRGRYAGARLLVRDSCR